MAIYHLTAKIISGGKGRSAVAAAAYRHGCRMYCEREARTYDYRHKSEANRSAIMLPEHVPDWLKEQLGNHTSHVASAKIWNAVEKFEKLHNAQYAREIEFAVPIELTRRENMKLVREFSKTFTDRGMIVDWSYHDKAGNPHVHMMMTLRPLTQDGFGPKRTVQMDALGEPLRNDKGVLVREHWAGTRADLVGWREGWARIVNTALEAKQVDYRVDHRSFADRGIDLIPTQHIGPEGRAMKVAGKYQERAEWIDEDTAENTKRILADPTKLLDLVTDQKAVFEAVDINRAMTVLGIAPVDQDHIWNQIHAGEHLELLQEPIENVENGEVICAAKYSTPELIAVEGRMRDVAIELEARKFHPVSQKIVAAVGEQFSYLSAEQQCVVEHLTKASGAVTLTGLAGTGKSTLLKAANVAWSVQGYRVHGVALAGKAADELSSASQIESRTLKSLQWQIENGRLELGPKDVVVLDEAGMVGSREMAWLLEQARDAGAKIVMVGDPAQLPAISAGAAFRGIINAIGTREVSTIRRQHDEWQRNASMDFARGRVAEGLAAYRQMGQVVAKPTTQDAREALASSVAQAISTRQDVLALAHTNSDVAELNRLIREKLVSNGQVRDSVEIESSRGQISVGRDDHIVFLQNNPALGVRNGTRGKVSDVTDKCISVWTEGGGSVSFDPRSYNAFAHGYAVTLHKAQGATVDHVRVLATPTMRQELAYVAMTRHRQSVQLYYGQSDFRGGNSHLAKSLGRAEAKETTLDYLPAGKPRDTARFAWARGVDVLDRWASAVGRGVKAIASLVKIQAVVTEQSSSVPSKREERGGDPVRADILPPRPSISEPHPKWLVEPFGAFSESDYQKADDMARASEAYVEAREDLMNAPGFGRQGSTIDIEDVERHFHSDRENLERLKRDLCKMPTETPARRFESKRDAEFRANLSRYAYKSRMELEKKVDHLVRVYKREEYLAYQITVHIRSALRGGLHHPHSSTQALLELLADRTTYRPENWEKFEAELIKRLNDGFDIVSDVRRLKDALLQGAEEKAFECEDIRKTIPPVFEGREAMLHHVNNLDMIINHFKDTLAPQDYPKWLPSDHSIEQRVGQGLQFLSHATLRKVEKLYPAVSPKNLYEQYDLAVSASEALSKRSQLQLSVQMSDIERRANLVGVESMRPLERTDRVAAALPHLGKQYGAMMKLTNPTAALFNGLVARHVEVRQEVKTQGMGMSM